MANHVWKSKDSQIIARLAERLVPAGEEAEEEQKEEGEGKSQRRPGQARSGTQLETIEVRYMNAPPPKDLLNYKNMDLEMSLWAKTQAGWLSVVVLLIMATICFILTWILWGLHGY